MPQSLAASSVKTGTPLLASPGKAGPRCRAAHRASQMNPASTSLAPGGLPSFPRSSADAYAPA